MHAFLKVNLHEFLANLANHWIQQRLSEVVDKTFTEPLFLVYSEGAQRLWNFKIAAESCTLNEFWSVRVMGMSWIDCHFDLLPWFEWHWVILDT